MGGCSADLSPPIHVSCQAGIWNILDANGTYCETVDESKAGCHRASPRGRSLKGDSETIIDTPLGGTIHHDDFQVNLQSILVTCQGVISNSSSSDLLALYATWPARDFRECSNHKWAEIPNGDNTSTRIYGGGVGVMLTAAPFCADLTNEQGLALETIPCPNTELVAFEDNSDSSFGTLACGEPVTCQRMAFGCLVDEELDPCHRTNCTVHPKPVQVSQAPETLSRARCGISDASLSNNPERWSRSNLWNFAEP